MTRSSVTGHKTLFFAWLTDQTPEEMVDILRIYGGRNSIEAMAMTPLTRVRVDFVFKSSCDRNEAVYANPATTRDDDPVPGGGNLTLLRGSAYGTFSRAFVEFVLTDQLAMELLNWSRKSYSPDEHYWATLHQIGVNPQLRTPGGYNGILASVCFMSL